MGAKVLVIVGPTASGKSARAVEEGLKRGGEIVSDFCAHVYRGLDIGTEKITREEMRGVPHHLIDIRELEESYSAGDFVDDASRLIEEISSRGKLPILVGGTHFYFDALLHGLPARVPMNRELREKLETFSTEELFVQIQKRDPRRAKELDPKNRRRLIRALEIIEEQGAVPPRCSYFGPVGNNKNISWIVINPPAKELREHIEIRLKNALERGLIEEARRVREEIGNERLNEFGLEYKVVGEYLRDGRTKESLLPALSAKLWQLARRQKAWLKKLRIS